MARPARTTTPSDDLRERIVDAAVTLLETQGPKGFGQVRVARAAGVAQGHLTYYFPHKADLAAAVVERLSRDARRELEPLLGAALADPEAAHALFFAQVEKLLKNEKRSRAMLGLMAEALDDRALAKVLARTLVLQRGMMARLLGREADDPDVHIAVAALRGLGIENLLSHGDPAQAEAVVARFRTWLAGWQRPPERRDR
ncbi:MAG: TetR/AcrR family transcriptional regulator [Deltaproteobacteria bacterium]|nr:TetR/AcrR family transcriptional regulator [Deltaproteobacteria bacterium]